jgi:hypothetical protein
MCDKILVHLKKFAPYMNMSFLMKQINYVSN